MPTTIHLSDGPFEAPDAITVTVCAGGYKLTAPNKSALALDDRAKLATARWACGVLLGHSELPPTRHTAE